MSNLPPTSPNLDSAFSFCCKDPNILTHKTDTHRLTDTHLLGYRGTNGLAAQPTFPCPIFLGSLPCLFLVPQENSHGLKVFK